MWSPCSMALVTLARRALAGSEAELAHKPRENTWCDRLAARAASEPFTSVAVLLTQLAVNYYLSAAWTASAYVSADLGGGRSEGESFPQRGNAPMKVTRFL